MIAYDAVAHQTWQTSELPLRRRTDAEEALAEATVRLQQAKLEALLGIRYDADAFDSLVVEYKGALARANAVREAAQQLRSAGESRATAGSNGPATAGTSSSQISAAQQAL